MRLFRTCTVMTIIHAPSGFVHFTQHMVAQTEICKWLESAVRHDLGCNVCLEHMTDMGSYNRGIHLLPDHPDHLPISYLWYTRQIPKEIKRTHTHTHTHARAHTHTPRCLSACCNCSSSREDQGEETQLPFDGSAAL